jgi:hypothetical protein
MFTACGASIMEPMRAVPNVPIIGSPTGSDFPMPRARRAGAGACNGAANVGASSSRTHGYTSRSAHFSAVAPAPGAPALPRSTAIRSTRPRRAGAGGPPSERVDARPCASLEQRWSTCRVVDVHEANHPARYEAWRQWQMCAPWREVAPGDFERRFDGSHVRPCEGAPWA